MQKKNIYFSHTLSKRTVLLRRHVRYRLFIRRRLAYRSTARTCAVLVEVAPMIRGCSTAAVRLLLLLHFAEIVSFGLALMLV